MPTSKELREMADTEWKNREERKGIHDKVSWTSGWISGYLTRSNPQAERTLNNLIAWIRETKDMARNNLDHNWGTQGDRHVELILSQVLDKYEELREGKDGE